VSIDPVGIAEAVLLAISSELATMAKAVRVCINFFMGFLLLVPGVSKLQGGDEPGGKI
jgi:hypothetical protein